MRSWWWELRRRSLLRFRFFSTPCCSCALYVDCTGQERTANRKNENYCAQA
jgi:hypothetical protein